MLDAPDPPDHFHDDESEEMVWPDLVTAFPEGDAGRGETLFAATLGCIACHGHPDAAGSQTVGPHLGGIGVIAGQRVSGKSAAQYLYESILEPDANGT